MGFVVGGVCDWFVVKPCQWQLGISAEHLALAIVQSSGGALKQTPHHAHCKQRFRCACSALPKQQWHAQLRCATTPQQRLLVAMFVGVHGACVAVCAVLAVQLENPFIGLCQTPVVLQILIAQTPVKTP